jgi:hypothetical protein
MLTSLLLSFSVSSAMWFPEQIPGRKNRSASICFSSTCSPPNLTGSMPGTYFSAAGPVRCPLGMLRCRVEILRWSSLVRPRKSGQTCTAAQSPRAENKRFCRPVGAHLRLSFSALHGRHFRGSSGTMVSISRSFFVFFPEPPCHNQIATTPRAIRAGIIQGASNPTGNRWLNVVDVRHRCRGICQGAIPLISPHCVPAVGARLPLPLPEPTCKRRV